MAVSPFDGANRIRFKGSSDCGFPIAECGFKLQIQRSESHSLLDSQPQSYRDRGSPESCSSYCQTFTMILEPFECACNGVTVMQQCWLRLRK